MQLANAGCQCEACCFYRLIELDSGGARELCALTGEKRPLAGMNGCRFIPGQFAELNSILGLTGDHEAGNTGDPNTVKQVAAFSRKGMNVTNIHSLDDSIGLPINHTAKARRQFVRPSDRETSVAHSARERTGCLFRV